MGLSKHYVTTGRITERGLARLAGVSQPHMHNVLKGIRHLSPASADRILAALGFALADVLWWQPGDPEPRSVTIPIVRERVGPGNLADTGVLRGYMVLPRAVAGQVTDPVAARLSQDPLLPAAFRTNDLVVIDRNPDFRDKLAGGWCWLVAERGGLRVRYLQQAGDGISVAGEAPPGKARDWEPLAEAGPDGTGPITPGPIRGRIVWISREVEEAPPREAGAVGCGD